MYLHPDSLARCLVIEENAPLPAALVNNNRNVKPQKKPPPIRHFVELHDIEDKNVKEVNGYRQVYVAKSLTQVGYHSTACRVACYLLLFFVLVYMLLFSCALACCSLLVLTCAARRAVLRSCFLLFCLVWGGNNNNDIIELVIATTTIGRTSCREKQGEECCRVWG